MTQYRSALWFEICLLGYLQDAQAMCASLDLSLLGHFQNVLCRVRTCHLVVVFREAIARLLAVPDPPASVVREAAAAYHLDSALNGSGNGQLIIVRRTVAARLGAGHYAQGVSVRCYDPSGGCRC